MRSKIESYGWAWARAKKKVSISMLITICDYYM